MISNVSRGPIIVFNFFKTQKGLYHVNYRKKIKYGIVWVFFFNLVVNNIFSLGYYVQTFYFIYFILMHCYCLLDTLCRYLRDS